MTFEFESPARRPSRQVAVQALPKIEMESRCRDSIFLAFFVQPGVS